MERTRTRGRLAGDNRRLVKVVIFFNGTDFLQILLNLPEFQTLTGANSLAVAQQYEASLTQAELSSARTRKASGDARAVEIDTGWALHDFMLGLKAQVVAQFGPDSEMVEMICLKRKSNYKRPARHSVAE